MESADPPAAQDVARLMANARIAFPGIPVMLGCARPAGPYRAATDRFALEAGLDAIAFPVDATITLARDMGLEPRFARTCCALVIDAV